MIVRTAVAALLILLLIALVEFAPFPLLLAVSSAVVLLSLYELGILFGHCDCALYPPAWLFSAGLPWLWAYLPDQRLNLLLLMFFATLAWAVPAARQLDRGLASASGNLLALVYLGVPVSLLVEMAQGPQDHLWVLLSAIWAGDAAALVIGRAWGRHRVTPRISPNKSLEGYLSAVAAAALAGLLTGSWLTPQQSAGFLLLAGAFIGVCGIGGDLFESLLKRGAGVKDSSSLLPGHGGLLDRLDSLLFALPGYYLLLNLTGN